MKISYLLHLSYLLLFWYGSCVAVEDFRTFVDAVADQYNFTSSGIHNAGGYTHVSGGRFISKGGSSHMKLGNFKLPSIKSGCSGIDIDFGAVSWPDRDAIKRLLTDTLSATKYYAINIALDSISPSIKNSVNDVMSMVRSVTNQTINSCQMGALISGNMMERVGFNIQKACSMRSENSVDNAFGDFLSRGLRCQKEGVAVNKELERKDKLSLCDTDCNLTWEIIKHVVDSKGALVVENNNTLAEFLMSITGTIIKRLENDKPSFEVKVPLYKGDKLHNLILDSSFVKYKCDNKEKCLVVSDDTLDMGISLRDRMKDNLERFQELVRRDLSDTPPPHMDSGVLKEILERSGLNLVQIFRIDAELCRYRNYMSTITSDLSTAIATDLLTGYILEILHEISQASDLESFKNVDDHTIKNFRDSLNLLGSEVASLRRRGVSKVINKIMANQQQLQQFREIETVWGEYLSGGYHG